MGPNTRRIDVRKQPHDDREKAASKRWQVRLLLRLHKCRETAKPTNATARNRREEKDRNKARVFYSITMTV